MKLEAASRLLAWKPNPITKKSLWQSLLIDIADYEETGKTIKGYTLLKHRQYQDWALYDDEAKKVVAVVELGVGVKNPQQVFIAAVAPAYQGKGVGLAFYEWLLHKYKSLASSVDLSKGATKLWSQLIKRHHAYIRVRLDDQVKKVKIHGFDERHGFTWPVVERDGQLICLGDLKVRGKEEDALNYFTYVVTL